MTVALEVAARQSRDDKPLPSSKTASASRPRRAKATGRHRRMREPDFRAEQWSRRFDAHVAPINQLVDDLIEEREGSWMPYVAPLHGGVDAEVLLLYQDPGPMTSTELGGSGFLCSEDDDPSAELLADCLDAAGVEPARVVPWNSFPWFRSDQAGLSAAELVAGLDPLHRLLDGLPKVHTVVAHGTVAVESWRRFEKRFPDVAARYRALSTFHTSGRGVTRGGRQSRAEGTEHIIATLRAAVHDEPAPTPAFRPRG
ncbi:MAG: uracil-DNA glycosylase [Acidimicrobiales bacterium]